MKRRVFISYALQDRKLAEAAKNELEQRGHAPDETVVFDPEGMSSGVDLRRLLRAQIEASDMVVLVLTDAAASSHWVNYELGLADALGKRIVVVTSEEEAYQPLLRNLSNYQVLKPGDISKLGAS